MAVASDSHSSTGMQSHGSLPFSSHEGYEPVLADEQRRVPVASNNPGSCMGRKNNRMGKEDGLPSKNLMAERSRKRPNDRLSMLRSVVPSWISKLEIAIKLFVSYFLDLCILG